MTQGINVGKKKTIFIRIIKVVITMTTKKWRYIGSNLRIFEYILISK